MTQRVHIAHVSTAGSVDIIRRAKDDGVKVTCETAPHYFTLTEGEVEGYNTNAKMNPPLRTEVDVKAIVKGLKDGTIDVIATDHAPHLLEEKNVEFRDAAFGIVGLETALGLILTELVDTGDLTLVKAIEKLTSNPAKILGRKIGTLAVGCPGDVTTHRSGEVLQSGCGRVLLKEPKHSFQWLEAERRRGRDHRCRRYSHEGRQIRESEGFRLASSQIH